MAPKKRIQAGDKIKKIGEPKRAKLIAEQAARIAEWEAQALIAAEQLGIKQETGHPLNNAEKKAITGSRSAKHTGRLRRGGWRPMGVFSNACQGKL